MAEIDQHAAEQEPQPDSNLERAQELLGHFVAIRAVRTDLRVRGGQIGNEQALTLLGPESYFAEQIRLLGQGALLDELSKDRPLGRKAILP